MPTGVNINYIPYQGTTPAVNALLGDHLTSVMASYPNVVGVDHGPAGCARWRPPRRSGSNQCRNVPTVAEAAGIKDFEVDIWFGVNRARPRRLAN